MQGAKLASITQVIAYRGLREAENPITRRTTTRNLEKIRTDIRDQNGELETDEAIWESLRSQPISPKIQDFLYKAIHGTHKIGRYWLNIENYNTRSECTTCGREESMDHILTECPSDTRITIWNAARNMWPHDDNLWPNISPGVILGCGLIEIAMTHQARPGENPLQHTDAPTMNPGATRLATILISEAAYLVWTLRCDRVINERQHTIGEVESAWRRAVNRRLSEDAIVATKVARREEYTKLVISTWQKALRKRHGELPEKWLLKSPHF